MGASGTPPPNSAEQNSLSWASHADNVLDFVGRFLSIKQHQKDQARSELQGAISLSQAGFPVDPKTFSKMVKKSGLPIATDQDTLQAFHSSAIEKKQQDQQGGRPAEEGKSGAGGGGAQPMQMPKGAPDYMQGVVDAHNKISSSGKPLDAGEEMGLYMNVLAGKARQMSSTKTMTEQQKAENASTIETLKAQGLAGDNVAKGRLMGMGEIPINVDYEKWTSMTPAQKTGMFDVMSGHESEADRLQRGTRIGESMLTSGKFSDPSAALQAGQILASGGELPASLKSKMKPFTFSELADQSRLMSQLIELGVSPDKVGRTAQSAAVGGLENALPKGMKPVVLQQLELDKERLGLEELRYGKELEIAARATAAEQRKGMNDADKATLEEFKSLVELKKAGGAIPDSIVKGAQAKAAKVLNLEPKETNTLFHFLTGGTKTEYVPHVSEEGQATVDKFSGRPDRKTDQKPEGSSGFSGFVKGLRGKKSEDGDSI